MGFLRPKARAFLGRWAEVAFSGGSLLFSLSVAFHGGWVALIAGGVFALISAQWLWIALRRLRFALPLSAPGYVEIDEGVIRYLAPRGTAMGGQMALRDIGSIRLIRISNGRLWQLRDLSGQMLLVPTTAKGASTLYDAFATLPGIDMGTLSHALHNDSHGLPPLWKRG